MSRVLQKCVVKDICCCHTKRRIGGQGRARLNKIIYEGCRLQIHSHCHSKGRIGGVLPANPSLDNNDKDIQRCVFCDA